MTKIKKQPPQLSINPIDERIKIEFLQYQKEHNIASKNKLLEIIWNSFKYSQIQFTDEEKQLIERALKMSNLSIEELKKRAILRAARNIITNKDKPIVLKEVDKNSRTSARAADLRVADIVAEMMLHNDQAEQWYKRKFINQKTISEYAKDRKQSSMNNLSPNTEVIKRYLENYQEVIAKHHAKYDMHEDHNRKVFNFIRIKNNQ
jgi:predicted ribonuclease YlaK